ncbi:uncharacterized protein FOMMEDRAFT_30552 [Fomitiporia mediterranea MF3/22]|uniref:uncharacterized protein n=1 Tax=Fomitiporia mediterranea (strain MF3/22) TaxID=694068 RepID=UPI0004407A26|nr:uncharacterized protein FOMMEDRAFT_30552 [Fomitiporia mediterranea MF3/22]EJD00553.1 hypothetical protein FOMMEDRAFT_30552 [Fomitiporia mediterranea MF3/22]
MALGRGTGQSGNSSKSVDKERKVTLLGGAQTEHRSDSRSIVRHKGSSEVKVVKSLRERFNDKYNKEYMPLYLKVHPKFEQLQKGEETDSGIPDNLEQGCSILPTAEEIGDFNTACQKLSKVQGKLKDARKHNPDEVASLESERQLAEHDKISKEKHIENAMKRLCVVISQQSNEEISSPVKEAYIRVIVYWNERKLEYLAKSIELLTVARDNQRIISAFPPHSVDQKYQIQNLATQFQAIYEEVEGQRQSEISRESIDLLKKDIQDLRDIGKQIDGINQSVKASFEPYEKAIASAIGATEILWKNHQKGVKFEDLKDIGSGQEKKGTENSKTHIRWEDPPKK